MVRILVEKSVRVPMRDGVSLATDVYRPDVARRLPVLVQRLPYNKESNAEVNHAIDVMRAVQGGYAVAVQDVRGRFASGGTFRPFSDEAADGADTIAWATAQPWSIGNVGMVGSSYGGAAQWFAASGAPAGLCAFAPVATAADCHSRWTHQGGAFALGFNLKWAIEGLAFDEVRRRIATGAATSTDLAALTDAANHLAGDLYHRLPLVNVPEVAHLAPYYRDWLLHPENDHYWQTVSPPLRYEQIAAPALAFGGWYDLFLAGTLANWMGMRREGGSAVARSLQRLVVGPWSHHVMAGAFAERAYGIDSAADMFDITGAQLRYFGHLLKGEANSTDTDRPVRVFVMGANTWRSEDDWPLPDTRFVAYYLRSDGHANTASGDGLLSAAGPGDDPEDVYVYDPRDPVPTVGGPTSLPGAVVAANAGPMDQRAVESRSDVLCYTTPPLGSALEVTGPVELVLFASSSARDTDYTGKLVDVDPSGRAEILTEGILRARYRAGCEQPKLLRPRSIYELRLDLVATSNLFHAGHRIRLEVTSSNFPRFARNTNTGNTIAEDGAADLVRAVNRVMHTKRYPSRLVLPVIDRR
jgi:putative CocE/NonD family hydrolase